MAQGVFIVVMLLFAASLSAIFFKKINFPYTIGLVIVGLLLSFACSSFKLDTAGVRLTPDLIMYILLPALIFEAAVHIDTRSMMRNIVPTMVLAAPGVVISTLAVGMIMYITTPLNIAASMLFGALISATDPVAVISLFKEIGAPRRLTSLVDGESLFNDATAIVLFNIIKGITFSGIAMNMATGISGTLDFIWVFFAGLLVGAVIGMVMIMIIAKVIGEPLLQIALSTIVAYTAFIVADKVFEVSGVMSAVGAGVVFGYYGNTHFPVEVKRYIEQFWEFTSFIANSFIFLLLGFTQEIMFIDLTNYRPLLSYIGFAILAITVARAIVVFGLCPIIGMLRRQDEIDWKYQIIIFWGGLRGAVPMALVLSLPENFHSRELLLSITLGVILFTLLIQGTTVKKLMHLFRMDVKDSSIQGAYHWAEILNSEKVLTRLDQLEREKNFPPEMIARYRAEYRKIKTEGEIQLQNHRHDKDFLANSMRKNLWLEALAVAGNTYKELAERNIISPITYRNLLSITERHEEIVNSAKNLPHSMHNDGFDFKIEQWFFKFCTKYAFDGKLYRKILVRNLARDLEKSYAIREATEKIGEMLEYARPFFQDHLEILEECRTYFQEVSVQINKLVEKMKKSHPELMEMITDETLRRYVLDAKVGNLHDLSEKGLMPQEVSAELTAGLEQELRLSIRRVS